MADSGGAISEKGRRCILARRMSWLASASSQASSVRIAAVSGGSLATMAADQLDQVARYVQVGVQRLTLDLGEHQGTVLLNVCSAEISPRTAVYRRR